MGIGGGIGDCSSYQSSITELKKRGFDVIGNSSGNNSFGSVKVRLKDCEVELELSYAETLADWIKGVSNKTRCSFND